ncbi:MAG: hypothetical protein R3F14_35130 [Polyangiaceae bacterium]
MSERVRAAERGALWAALGAGLAAWGGFAAIPPMRVRVGREVVDAWVPAHYQAAAFPAFGAILYLVGRGFREGDGLWGGRAALLGASCAVAVTRLLGAHPLSGHAVFLAAVCAHELAARRRSPVLLGAAALGLAITGAYKAEWGDGVWGAVSAGVGAVLGAASWRVGRSGAGAKVE